MWLSRAIIAAGPQRGGGPVAPDAGEGAAAGAAAVRGAPGARRPRPAPPALPHVRAAAVPCPERSGRTQSQVFWTATGICARDDYLHLLAAIDDHDDKGFAH